MMKKLFAIPAVLAVLALAFTGCNISADGNYGNIGQLLARIVCTCDDCDCADDPADYCYCLEGFPNDRRVEAIIIVSGISGETATLTLRDIRPAPEPDPPAVPPICVTDVLEREDPTPPGYDVAVHSVDAYIEDGTAVFRFEYVEGDGGPSEDNRIFSRVFTRIDLEIYNPDADAANVNVTHRATGEFLIGRGPKSIVLADFGFTVVQPCNCTGSNCTEAVSPCDLGGCNCACC
ncbi:MAG: hypothetical protein FWB79_05060 [Treponema sp.]|nr:hypothetical protein [Treponema sp.]